MSGTSSLLQALYVLELIGTEPAIKRAEQLKRKPPAK